MALPTPNPPGFTTPEFAGTTPGQHPNAPSTSATATASLVSSLLGTMCFGPLGGIVAIILGAIALWQIRTSQGRLSGRGTAITAISIGSLTTVAYTIALVLFIRVLSSPSVSFVPPPPPYFSPPPPSPSILPSPPTTSHEIKTTTTQIGKVIVVDIGIGEPDLAAALKEQQKRAKEEKQLLLLHTSALGCRPCLGVAAALSHPKMQVALAHIRLVRIDVHDFHEELTELSIPNEVIPGFFFLDDTLLPTQGIHGGEWDEDIVDNIEPVLSAFVRGKYHNRRHHFHAPQRPKSHGTML